MASSDYGNDLIDNEGTGKVKNVNSSSEEPSLVNLIRGFMLVCACVLVPLQMCGCRLRQAIWLPASSSVALHLSFWDKVQLILCLGWLISPCPGITGEQDPVILLLLLFCFVLHVLWLLEAVLVLGQEEFSYEVISPASF